MGKNNAHNISHKNCGGSGKQGNAGIVCRILCTRFAVQKKTSNHCGFIKLLPFFKRRRFRKKRGKSGTNLCFGTFKINGCIGVIDTDDICFLLFNDRHKLFIIRSRIKIAEAAADIFRCKITGQFLPFPQKVLVDIVCMTELV